MPRGKGGKRQGTPGTAYGNRSDLNMPISTVPNQEYGKAAMQRSAQQAVPMGQSPVAPTVPTAPTQSQPLPRPGSMPHIAPTTRPNEPVTNGLPFGPGAGPEALNPAPNIGQILKSGAGQSALSSMIALQAEAMGL
jgi:hypothetical protein